MKKVLLFAALGALAVGCSSSNKTQSYQDYQSTTQNYQGYQSQDSLTNQYARYQIVDQEFDNLSIPNDGYDRVAPYEDQVSGSSYIQSTTRKADSKPARSVTVRKTVVDGEGNLLPAGSSAAVTDQEALPDEAGAY